jgi:hypothetical protein
MTSRTKRIQTFLTDEDELTFSRELLSEIGDIALIDGQRWASEEPPLIKSIPQASGSEVYLWDRSAVPVIAGRPRPDGSFQGPLSGIVIQFERSRLVDGELRSGRLAAGYDDQDVLMGRFVERSFAVMRRVTTDRIRTMAGERLPYRVGRAAETWARLSPGNRLRDRSVAVYFSPLPTAD